MLRAALRRARDLPGVGLEFGVYQGLSFNLSARAHPHRRFHGFDSFRGFPEDGRPDWKLDFATLDLPAVPANGTLHPGWFEDTLPAFLAGNAEPVAFVNIDCDLYSSARTALMGLAGRLRPGTVIYFDELLNYDSYLWNEMLALFEFLEATGMGVEWIALDRRLRPLETTLAMLSARRHPRWEDDVAAGYGRPAACVLTPANTDMALLDRPEEHARIARLSSLFGTLTERFRARRLNWEPCDPDETPG